MDEDYLFLSTDFKPENNLFLNGNVAKSSKSLTTTLVQSSSDDESMRLDASEANLLVTQGSWSRDKMTDRFNTEMSPDDFMFFESQECSLNPEIPEIPVDLDVPRAVFSPSKYFDLFSVDSEHDDFQFMNYSSVDQPSPKELKHKECKKNNEETQNKMILNGMLNPRGLCPSLPRMKHVGAVTSCGSILRQSASMPSTRLAASRMKVSKNSAGSPDSAGRSCSNSSSDDTDRRSRGTYSPLEDHRYYARVKRSESPPPLKKRNFSMSSNVRHSKSASCSGGGDEFGSSVMHPKMSILETFLRATCPLDPNKGSDATLATEGMLNLCIREPKAPKKKQPLCMNSNNNLLKKLLTGEIEHEKCQEEEEECLSNDSRDDEMSYAMDSPLVDGFWLDAGLSIDEKGIYNVPDFTSDWQEDYLQGSLVEFENCMKLQDHQDALCMQHYAGGLL